MASGSLPTAGLTNSYDDTIQQTKLIKKKALEVANDVERVHVQKHWPFDDFDDRMIGSERLSICTWALNGRREGKAWLRTGNGNFRERFIQKEKAEDAGMIM